MLDHLSPRERREILGAAAAGQAWARVIQSSFLEGTRLLLGSERSRSESDIARAGGLDPETAREAIAVTARWCAGHGLHLLGYPGDDAAGGWHHFMAVG